MEPSRPSSRLFSQFTAPPPPPASDTYPLLWYVHLNLIPLERLVGWHHSIRPSCRDVQGSQLPLKKIIQTLYRAEIIWCSSCCCCYWSPCHSPSWHHRSSRCFLQDEAVRCIFNEKLEATEKPYSEVSSIHLLDFSVLKLLQIQVLRRLPVPSQLGQTRNIRLEQLLVPVRLRS